MTTLPLAPAFTEDAPMRAAKHSARAPLCYSGAGSAADTAGTQSVEREPIP